MPEPSPLPEPHGDLPVVLDVTGWPCLVVGGGPVAARRVAVLAAAGAMVTVVAPDLSAAIEEAEGEAGGGGEGEAGPRLAVERRPYRRGEAARYRLVAPATGRPEADAAVVADATGAGVLVAGADRATPGTLHFPAVHRAGSVTLAVSTAGTSPALARWLCERLAGCLPSELATLVTLVGDARDALQQAGIPTGSVEWAALLDEAAVLVEAGRADEAGELLRSARAGSPTGGPIGSGPDDPDDGQRAAGSSGSPGSPG